MRELWSKLTHFSRRDHFDESLDDEIRFHIESRAEELQASGMPPQTALAQARREFGPAARAAEDSRDAWRWMWIEDLLRDLRHASRALARDRGFALTAILSLALGIGANTTIFSLAAEFLFSQPSVRNPETLFHATMLGDQEPMRVYRLLRDTQIFDGLAGMNPMAEMNWRHGDESLRIFSTAVSDNFFDVTGTPVATGRPIAPGERNAVVVSHRFWQSRLNGDPQILGRLLVLDGKPYTITGVLPEVHRTLTGFGYAPDVYISTDAENASFALYGRLPRNVSRAATLARWKQAAEEIDKVYPEPTRKRAKEAAIAGLVGVERLREGPAMSLAAFFALLLAVVGLLLVIACANVAGLLLARGGARQHEFAVRASIGAGRGRLVRQMLTESLLLSLVGTAAGLVLNWLLTGYLNNVALPMPFPIRLAIQPDSRLLLYAALIAISTALIAGLLPALTLTRTGAGALLKRDERQVSGHKASLRTVLVAGQLAVSVLVLILAGLSVRNLIASAELNPGFDLKNTAWTQLRLTPENYTEPERVRALVTRALDDLRAVPGVQSATLATFVPLNDHFAGRVTTFDNDQRIEHSWNAVGPDYLRTMGIDVLAGRDFTPADRAGAQRVVILNEALARRLFPNGNPVGRRLRFGIDRKVERTVIGIARNAKYSSIGERDRPAMYEPYFQVGGGRVLLNFLVKTAGPPQPATLKAINTALLAIDPSAAAETKPMSLATGFALLPSQMGAYLLGAMGALGLALASVGLYGVLAWSLSRRTREIGLRVALGARRPDILRLVLAEGAWVLAAGLATGAFLAFFVTRPLARFLVPGLAPSDPATYLAVTLILLAVGCTASLIPALRALRIHPMTALRYE